MNRNRTLTTGKIFPQLTREQAIKMAKSGIWKKWSDEQIVGFQLYQDKMCMDFDRFHEALEKCLGRPVWTHELAFIDNIRLEFEGIKTKPSFEEIMNLIPEEKRLFFVASDESHTIGDNKNGQLVMPCS